MSKRNRDKGYQAFVERVVEAGECWGLQDKEGGWASCESQEYECDVIVFWSDRELAAQHVAQGMKDYTPVAIPLSAFINQWLKGMDDDGNFAGPDWLPGEPGPEVEPVDLADALDEEAGTTD